MKYCHGVIEVWMKNHLVSDSDCNTVDLQFPLNLQGITNNVGLAFSVGDTILRFTLTIEQDNLNC